jgi:hypothetical protein
MMRGGGAKGKSFDDSLQAGRKIDGRSIFPILSAARCFSGSALV